MTMMIYGDVMQDIEITIDKRRVTIDTYDVFSIDLAKKLTQSSGVKFKHCGCFMDTTCLMCSKEDFKKIDGKMFTITVENFSDINKM